MGLFSRRRAQQEAAQADEPPEAGEVAGAAQERQGPGDDVAGGRGSRHGPWDVAEVPELGARIDLGALRVPGVPGMQLRMEMDAKGARAVAANLGVEGSALQVQAFAAPRSYGIWDELRAELASSVTRQGGTAQDLPGPFGPELLARLPVRTAEGRSGHRPARFLGVDGPRWFVRGVLTGRAAMDKPAAVVLERVFSEIVGVRGDEARAPRDLLPRHLPGKPPADALAAAEDPGADVLRRGPEITETR